METENNSGLAKNPVLRTFVLGLALSGIVLMSGLVLETLTPSDALWLFFSCTLGLVILDTLLKRIEAKTSNKVFGNG